MYKQSDTTSYLECPEKITISAGIFYTLLSLFVIPYYLNLLMIDVSDPVLISWYEFAYHLINCFVVVLLLKEHLLDAFFMFRLQCKACLLTAKQAVIAIAVVLGILYVADGLCNIEWLSLAFWSAMPMLEMEWLFFGSDLICYNPLAGALCAVIFAPIAISCLYYCIGFVPAFNRNHYLGYPAVALITTLFHIRNILGGGDPLVEIISYFAQLPIHLIACWAYKKSDNIFVPILTLIIANLLSCGRLIWLLIGF